MNLHFNKNPFLKINFWRLSPDHKQTSTEVKSQNFKTKNMETNINLNNEQKSLNTEAEEHTLF